MNSPVRPRRIGLLIHLLRYYLFLRISMIQEQSDQVRALFPVRKMKMLRCSIDLAIGLCTASTAPSGNRQSASTLKASMCVICS